MFTGHLFNLRDFTNIPGLGLQRDCQFAFVGKIPTRVEPRLVACGKASHISEALNEHGICGLIVPHELEELVPPQYGLALSAEPMAALMQIQTVLAREGSGQWQDFDTRIHPDAIIKTGAIIAERNVVIGNGTTVHPGAIICERSIIGENCSIGPGAVIGTDAFEVDTTTDPQRIVPQSGGVQIGNHVDIQAKCTVVRATFGGFTELGDETKFDCQVHFAHDSRTGRRVHIAACAEISGRVYFEDDVFVGPNVSITNGCRIGAGSFITIGSVVTRDVHPGGHVTGNFAVDHKKWLKFVGSVR
ncbi:hypothetical protein D5I55_12055 [Chakrabartia godavariana]|nr:hypothetical protein D5I55_12055 [Chakrabartia godavariana]